jgi:hypothetical protein
LPESRDGAGEGLRRAAIMLAITTFYTIVTL